MGSQFQRLNNLAYGVFLMHWGTTGLQYFAKRNETKRNGTLRNGTLRNGTLRNGTLRNGTLRNGSLRNGTLRNGYSTMLTKVISH